jgi:hypothetical protein
MVYEGIGHIMISNKLCPEPLLEENPNRFVLFPIKYGDIWRIYKQ